MEREAELAGKAALARYPCGACHTIPGVEGAEGDVAPPLTNFGDRTWIAGRIINNPENLARWIMNPQEVDPETKMPDLNVSEEDARAIAAYLENLREGEVPSRGGSPS